ncbi:MAG: Trm112 family protein [Betaproteobacteria bacterium]|nr:Trm112 family protein [Betaproteobacteria bacterium]
MDNRLLEILACPICKNGLRHDRQALELICDHDHLAFPIRDVLKQGQPTQSLHPRAVRPVNQPPGPAQPPTRAQRRLL